MASNVANRKTWRKAIAAELTPLLTGSGKPAQAVYDGLVGDFGVQSPVVVFSSGGSRRSKEDAFGTAQETVFFVDVNVYSLYAEETASGTWDEMDAEDAIDDIEKIIADYVMDNGSRETPVSGVVWTTLTYDERTETGSALQPVELGGAEYRRERIPLRISIMGATA